MIGYTLGFEQYGQHLIDVTIEFTADADQQLWMPVWIPGSYLVREFARHVSRLTVLAIAADGQTQPRAVHKTRKNQWQIACAAGESLRVSYQVYAFDLSVRGAYVDQSRVYVNPACVCLAVTGQEDTPHEMDVLTGAAFSGLPVACTLTQRPVLAHGVGYAFVATHYADLIDHPFEIASLSQVRFEVEGIPHAVAISGRHQTDLLRLSQDLSRICQTQIQLFGGAPFDQYLFMVMATGNSYGGLEHQDCTSLITPREDLPRLGELMEPSAAYRRFLGLCSHEYFHAWLVKCIRPEGFIAPDLNQEVYTPLLWVFEGFTSYYDDLLLCRSGVISQAAYLELLSEQITRYQQNAGRAHQSVSESSFDAWIKYYRPDENSANAGTSYYNKGALVALCLDVLLRQRGSTLDAVMQALYQRAQAGLAVTPNTLPELCLALIGDDLQDFWRDYVDGVVELPLVELLATVGVRVEEEPRSWPFGLKFSDSAQGVVVQQVLRDSVAARAGLSAQDVLVALDGIRATSALLTQVAGRYIDPMVDNQTLTCHVFRRDELTVLHLRMASSAMNAARLSVIHAERVSLWLTDPMAVSTPCAV